MEFQQFPEKILEFYYLSMNLVKTDSSVRTKSDLSKLLSVLAISSLNKELIIKKFDLLWSLQTTAQLLDFYVRSGGYYFSV